MEKEIFSLCFMCSVRCPIKVTVKDGKVKWVEGNPFVQGIESRLCPKGAAGISMLYDSQRVTSPMIREGERGEGAFRKASWDEALDYASEKLSSIIKRYGGKSVVLLERANLATHVSKTLMKGLGSPNHFTHDALCKGSVNTACRSLFGYTDAEMGMQYNNARHIILYGRNIFEAVSVKEVGQVMEALSKGAKLTYIDPRVTVTATKAHRYWMIRPGTDLALNYALIHTIIKEHLYDEAFVHRWVKGLNDLKEFIAPYTPLWAEKETGIGADQILTLAREVSLDKPSVIFHFGYRGAHHKNEIYFRRSIMILNTLMGSIEAKGGFFFKKGPHQVNKKAPKKLTGQILPKIDAIRMDKVGTKEFPLPDAAHGVAQMIAPAILNEDPYPVKAMIINRFDPLKSVPDTHQMKKAFEKLDLIVAIDINYSDAAWYADIILPESTYFERTDCIQQANGLKPQLFLRKKAVSPQHETKEGAMILKALGDRLGIGDLFPYESMEDLVEWQLEGTGFTMEDFNEKGFVAYTQKPIFWNQEKELSFKTPSGKIEFHSSLLEDAGFQSFPAYEPILVPKENQFRLVVGRVALHTHVSTQNNPYLNELFSENTLWINKHRAQSLRISNNDWVRVNSGRGAGKIRAFVTDLIHPDAAFMVHGFGHEAKWAARSFNKGVSDSVLQKNITDPVGGSPALHDTFISVEADLS